MPTYKLHYYNARGYAEAIRMTFKVAKKEFEDNRFKDQEEFSKKKAGFEGGVVPVLEVDGVQIRQSLAILRYLGREFGLYGSNNLEAAVIDTVLDDVVEFRQVMIQIFFEKDEAKKAELGKTMMEEKLPAFMKKLEKPLEKNKASKQAGENKVYFVGSKLSIADILIFDLFNSLSKSPGMKDIVKTGTLLAEHTDTVNENGDIAGWLKARPETDH